jgi:hypothetical protein
MFFILLFLSMPLFAQQAVENMNRLADTIKGIFTSNLVKTILVIALCASALAFAVNKDNQRIRNSAIAIGVAAAIIMSATFIVDLVWV